MFYCAVFFDILPKFSDFVNFDYCIGKITSESIRLQPVFVQKRLKVSKKLFFVSSEIMRNSGNYIHDYAHSFFEEDFLSNALY